MDPTPATTTTNAPPTVGLLRTGTATLRGVFERVIVGFLFLSAAVASIATAAIFFTLLVNGLDFFHAVSWKEFLFGTQWAPDFGHFGSLPLLKGTFQIAIGAILLGIPLGVGTAVYLSEFASPRARSILKPTIELLAGIPSIIFGLVALFIIGPVISDLFDTGLFTALSASIALGVMVVPIIAAVSEDALRAVPRDLREGALALGATNWEATTRIVVPAAKSGIIASIILGFGRAIGETMVVTMAAGLRPNLTWDYREQAQTVTAYIANRAGGDLPQGSIEYLSIFAVGIVLFVITFIINIIAAFTLAAQRRRFA
jgi:phosphate transport system permease protein